MSKAGRVKEDFTHATEILELIKVFKNLTENKFYALASQKGRFARFGESFIDFFRLINFAATRHPLLSNRHPTVGILVITAEGSFLGDVNTKVLREALKEKENYPDSVFIVAGKKAAAELAISQKVVKVFEDMETTGLYETAIRIKDYLIDEVMGGRLGKVISIYPWPKNLNFVKARVIKLLPCDELISKQAEFVDSMENILLESDPEKIIGYLGNLWLSTKIYEQLFDTQIAAVAAQSQHLENSFQEMQKEKAAVHLKYRKVKKADIDKNLREVSAARMMIAAKGPVR